MKAWRISNILGGYTETTSRITVLRELVNTYGKDITEEIYKKVIDMNPGDESDIGDLHIICKQVGEKER